MPRSADEVRVAGVRLTHPDRVLFPEQGLTKRELANYLDAAADKMLTHVKGRLVTFLRCPEGRARKCFVQRHGGKITPKEFRTVRVPEKDGGTGEYLMLGDRRALVAAAQIGVLEFHVWGSHVDDVEKPDRIVFDLDPAPEVDFSAVREAALRVRNELEALGLESFALLTGGKGIHVVSPIRRRHGWKTVAGFCKALAERIAGDAPDRYVATMSKARRHGRIFIDHFRNNRSASAIAPFSPRARPGAPVAWPVRWEDLSRIGGADEITLTTARRRLAEEDAWKGYGTLRQGLKQPALRRLGVVSAA